MSSSSTLITLLSPNFIATYALPSNIAYGQAISGRTEVQIIELTDERVQAWAGGLDGRVSYKRSVWKRRIEPEAHQPGAEVVEPQRGSYGLQPCPPKEGVY